MRERINKKTSLIISILLIVCIITTSAVAFSMMPSLKFDAAKPSDKDGGNTTQPMADNDRAVDNAPLEDGKVPAGYTPWGSGSSDGWVAIGSEGEMQKWLVSNSGLSTKGVTPEYVGKNAYLTTDIRYASDKGAAKCYVTNNDGGKFDSIGTGRILDGNGFSVDLYGTKWEEGHTAGSGDFYSSNFVFENNGIIRNANFIKTGRTKLHVWNDESFYGIVVAKNNGTIINSSIYHKGAFNNWAGGNNSANMSGGFVGYNAGTIAYVTARYAAQSFVFSYSNEGGIWPNNPDSYGFFGGVVGYSKSATEQNITIIGENTSAGGVNWNTEGDGTCYVGGVVGQKRDGTITGVIFRGIIKYGTGADKQGVAVGETMGSVGYNGVYTSYEEGVGTKYMVGNNAAGTAWSDTSTRLDLAKYDVAHYKTPTFFTDYAVSLNYVITPKDKPEGKIVWDIKYNQNSATGASKITDTVFRSLAYGSVVTEHVFPRVNNVLVLTYGEYAKTTAVIENTRKEYNGQPVPYNDVNSSANDRFAYTVIGKDGNIVMGTDGNPIVYEAGLKHSYAGLKVWIDGKENFLPTNAGTYDITTKGEWINTDGALRVYGTNPDAYTGQITVHKKAFTIDANVISLNNYTKTYDGLTLLDYATINKIPTGVMDEKIDLILTSANFADKNAGANKNITVNYIFDPLGDVNANYLVDSAAHSGSITLAGVGTINTLGVSIVAGDFNLTGGNAYTKIYDKTTAYTGSLAVLPIYTDVAEQIALKNVNAVYNSANVVDANKIIITFQLADAYTNYHLTNTTVDIANATITPYQWTIGYADFSREGFYGDGTNTNITKVYNGNNIFDDGIMYANATPLGEFIKLKKNGTTPSTFAGVNVGKHDVTYTFEMAARNSGEVIPAEGGDTLGDYRNYNLANTEVNTTGTITPKHITVNEDSLTVDNKTKTYDGKTNVGGNIVSKALATGVMVSGESNADQMSDVNSSYARMADVEETLTLTVNSYAYINKDVVVSGGNKIRVSVTNTNANYIIVNAAGEEVTSIDVTATISAAVYTPTADAFTVSGVRVYNGTTDIKSGVTAVSKPTNVNEENVTLTVVSADYNSKNVASANNITVVFSLGNTNYTLGEITQFNYVDSTDNHISVTAFDIALNEGNFTFDKSRQYNATTNVNITAKDIATTVLDEKLPVTVVASYNAAGVNDASAITMVFATTDTNYNITNVDKTITTTGVVTPMEITVAAGSFDMVKTRAYNGGNVAVITNYAINGAGSETISLTDGGSAVFGGVNVGTYDITVTFAQTNPNYTLTNSTLTMTGGSITAKAVTIGAADIASYTNTKVYDGTTEYVYSGDTAFTQNTIKTGVGVGNDEETITLVFGNAAYNNAGVANADKITVGITQSNLNYTINANLDLAATITPYAVEGGATDTGRYTVTTEKEYDGSDAAATAIVEGMESYSGLGTDTFTFKVTGKYSKLIGNDLDITITFISDNANYTFKELTVTVKGKITAVQDVMVLTIDMFSYQATREYDGTDNLYDLTCELEFNGEPIFTVVLAKFDSKELGANKTITFIIKEAHEGYYMFDTYTFTATDGEITRRTVALADSDFTYAGTKAYDGTTAVPYGITTGAKATGVDTDSFTITIGTATYNSVGASDNKTISFTTVIADQAANDYYTILGTYTLSAKITKANIELTATSFTLSNSGVIAFNNKTAIGVNAVAKEGNIQYIAGVNGEKIELLNLAANFSSVNAGTTAINVTYTYENDNYNINTAVAAVGMINKHKITDGEIVLTYTATKIYDATATAAVTSGKVVVVLSDGSSYTTDLALKGLVASYDNANVNINGATFKTIKVMYLLDDASGNFEFSSIEVVDGVTYGVKTFADGVITAREITVDKANITVDKTKTYDGTTAYKGAAATHSVISGAYGGDVIALAFGGIAYNSKDVATADSMTVNFTQANKNYILTNTSVAIEGCTITTKGITVGEGSLAFTSGKTKVYNNSDSVAVTTLAVTGVNGETLTIVIDSAKYSSKNVGANNTIIVGISQTNGNYTINNEIVVTEGVDITAFQLNADHVDFVYDTTKIYDGALGLGGTPTASINFVNIGFDDADLLIASFSGVYTDKNNGTAKTIRFSFIVNNTNYNVEVSVKDYANGVIEKATLAVSAGDFDVVKTREYTGYGGADAATHKGTSGVGGEVVGLDVTATAYTGTDFNVGTGKTITITIGMKNDTVSANYMLDGNTVTVAGCAITPKEITVASSNFTLSNSGTKTYDKTNTAGVTVSGVAGVGTDVLVLNAAGVYNDINAGTGRTITVSYSLSDDAVNKNYTLAAVDIVFGDNTINQAILTVEYAGLRQSFRYNANPLVNVTARTTSGLIGDDTTGYTLATVTEITPGQAGSYKVTATPTNGNYKVDLQADLVLAFFKFENGKNLIENLEDFTAIGSNVEYMSYNFLQINDIDVKFGTLKGIKGDFMGTYDGGKKKITNAFLYNESLFERISGKVMNLELANFVINAIGSELVIGGLAGLTDASAVIDNVTFVGSIYATTTDALAGYVGGMVGKNNGTLKGTAVVVNIEAFGNIYAGGLIGYNNGKLIGDYNTVFAEVLAVGDTAVADNVIGFNEASAEIGNVTYLENGAITVNGDTVIVADSAYGTKENFRGMSDKLTTNAKVLDELKAYKDRYGIIKSSTSKVAVTNLREYELIGQYNYLDVEINANVQFFVGYTHVTFNGFRIGTINYKTFTIDSRAVEMYEYKKAA